MIINTFGPDVSVLFAVKCVFWPGVNEKTPDKMIQNAHITKVPRGVGKTFRGVLIKKIVMIHIEKHQIGNAINTEET